MLNLIFSLTGGSLIGAVIGSQLVTLTSTAFDYNPQNHLLYPSVLGMALIGTLAAYNSLPICV